MKPQVSSVLEKKVVAQGEVDGWELREDEKQRLHMRRHWRTKNFVKVGTITDQPCWLCIITPVLQALELCRRFGTIAEEEGHHPDLHITVCNEWYICF